MIVEIVALVNPGEATAQELTIAVEAIENLTEEGHTLVEEIPSTLFTYFFADGNTLFEEAVAQVSERKAELANDKENGELVAWCEEVQSATNYCESVDAFQQLQTDIASVLGRKKQDPKSYAKKQLSEVEDA